MVWAGVEDVGQLSLAEVSGLLRFLKLGGTMVVDDAAPESGAFGRSVRRELLRVFLQLLGVARTLHRPGEGVDIDRVGLLDIGQAHEAARLIGRAVDLDVDLHRAGLSQPRAGTRLGERRRSGISAAHAGRRLI